MPQPGKEDYEMEPRRCALLAIAACVYTNLRQLMIWSGTASGVWVRVTGRGHQPHFMESC